MRPGYWGANYFNFKWWRLKYWFENSVSGTAAGAVVRWGYRLQDYKTKRSLKKLKDEIEALEKEALTHEVNEKQALLSFSAVLKDKLAEAKRANDLDQLSSILELIELERIAALKAQELERAAALRARELQRAAELEARELEDLILLMAAM